MVSLTKEEISMLLTILNERLASDDEDHKQEVQVLKDKLIQEDLKK